LFSFDTIRSAQKTDKLGRDTQTYRQQGDFVNYLTKIVCVCVRGLYRQQYDLISLKSLKNRGGGYKDRWTYTDSKVIS
jgi:hypothetical protein